MINRFSQYESEKDQQSQYSPGNKQQSHSKWADPTGSKQEPSDREIVKSTVYESHPFGKPFTKEQAEYKKNYQRKQVYNLTLIYTFTKRNAFVHDELPGS